MSIVVCELMNCQLKRRFQVTPAGNLARSPVDGSAIALVFPNIESGNVFYKSSSQLSGARLAAVVLVTTVPCVLTSSADSEESKFLSIAMGCRLAG